MRRTLVARLTLGHLVYCDVFDAKRASLRQIPIQTSVRYGSRKLKNKFCHGQSTTRCQCGVALWPSHNSPKENASRKIILDLLIARYEDAGSL